MRVARGLVFFLAALMAASATPAGAQATASSADRALIERVAQNPREIVVLLDLARMYVEQGRFDEADQMLRRASLAVERARALAAGTGADATVSFKPGGAVRIGGNIKEPRKLRDVRPVYPEIARAAGVQGVVIIEAPIDAAGAVETARVLRSVPLLDEAALDAVRQWLFTPTLLNGVPTPVVMTLTVSFKLD